MTEISSAGNIVNDIVNARIGRSTIAPYASTVQSVIDALNARDEAIGEFLMGKAQEMDLDPDRVRPVLVEAGLLPAPVTPLHEATDEDMPAWARSLMDRISALETKKSKKNKD